jgi:hypothetical protein
MGTATQITGFLIRELHRVLVENWMQQKVLNTDNPTMGCRLD